MTARQYPSAGLRHDVRGTTLVEFALLIPVMGLMLMGFLDIGHTLYMRSVLQGEVQKAARDSGLEAGATTANQAAMDAKVRAQVLKLKRNATVTITRRAYRSFSQAAAAQAEPFTDTNGNGRCDAGEPYEDRNANGTRDLDGGNAGQGSAKDAVLYTVALSYPHEFPIDKMMNLPSTTTVKATTVMKNQPYGEQGTDTTVVRNCPA